MSSIYLLYSSFARKDEAISAARTLLSERLVACVNVVDQVTSLYRWEGTPQEENEVLFLAKTTAERAPSAMARLKELHPYQLPNITCYPASTAFAPFAQWVEGEVT